jgi:hypothetical protein
MQNCGRNRAFSILNSQFAIRNCGRTTGYIKHSGCTCVRQVLPNRQSVDKKQALKFILEFGGEKVVS